MCACMIYFLCDELRLGSASLTEGQSELSRNKYNLMCFYYRFCNVYKHDKCMREIALISFRLVSCRVSKGNGKETSVRRFLQQLNIHCSLLCECFGTKIALTSVCIHNETRT